MSSEDTLQIAQTELSKAEELEHQTQKVLDTAQQQAEGFRQQAEMHRNEYSRLVTKSQEEQRKEAEEQIEAAREEQKKKDDRLKTILG